MTSLETIELSESDSVVTNNQVSLTVKMGVSSKKSIPEPQRSSEALKFETEDTDKYSIPEIPKTMVVSVKNSKPDTPKPKTKGIASKNSMRAWSKSKAALKYETEVSTKNLVINLPQPKSATEKEAESNMSNKNSIPDLRNTKEALNIKAEVSNKDSKRDLPKSRVALLKLEIQGSGKNSITDSLKTNAASILEIGEPTSPRVEIRSTSALFLQPRVKSFQMGWAQVVEELSWKLSSVSVCSM